MIKLELYGLRLNAPRQRKINHFLTKLPEQVKLVSIHKVASGLEVYFYGGRGAISIVYFNSNDHMLGYVEAFCDSVDGKSLHRLGLVPPAMPPQLS